MRILHGSKLIGTNSTRVASRPKPPALRLLYSTFRPFPTARNAALRVYVDDEAGPGLFRQAGPARNLRTASSRSAAQAASRATAQAPAGREFRCPVRAG